MRRAIALCLLLFLSAGSEAVEPERWTVRTTEELLKGKSSGLSIGADGTVVPGPAMVRIATLPDAYVMSQASGSDGTLFVGTGGSGNVYRIDGEEVDLLFTSDEPQIYALEVAEGSLWVGTSPNGKLYRVDPRTGRHDVWFDPGEAYIWDIEVDGSRIWLATGVEGRLYEVTSRGSGRVAYDSPETHIRTVVEARGRVLAGGSGNGRIYEIGTDGSARALYDSSYSEISSITQGPDGTFWASAVTSTLPTSAPRGESNDSSGNSSSSSGSSSNSGGTPSVEVSFSFDSAVAAGSPSAGSSELYRIEPDGFVDTVWRLDREIIYDVANLPGGGVVVATGPNGRVYQLDPAGKVMLLASVPEKQIISIDRTGGGFAATTTNGGSVYRLVRTGSNEISLESEVRDTGRMSKFGEYEIMGRSLPADLVVEFRTGNSNKPDETWSNWVKRTGPEGESRAPAARFVQWRLSHQNAPAEMRIDAVTVAWLNRNVAPSIDAFAVAEPAVVFLSAGYPTSPGVVEATNPDQYGIFTSISEPSTPDAGKRYFRKGFRTVSWKTSDPNGDSLKHSLYFRPRGEGEWYRLRESIEGSSVNFDTTQLPDGEYELKLVVTDAPANETGALERARDGIFFIVDNTPPTIDVRESGNELIVSVRDASSAIGKSEVSIDVDDWKPLAPEDGLSDSREETYRLDKKGVDGRLVIVRTIDGYYNVSTRRIE